MFGKIDFFLKQLFNGLDSTMFLWFYNFNRFLRNFIECQSILSNVSFAHYPKHVVIFVLKRILTFMICVFVDSTVTIAQSWLSTRNAKHVYTIRLYRLPNTCVRVRIVSRRVVNGENNGNIYDGHI